MERKRKTLKAALLLRRIHKRQSKEAQIAEADKYYSDEETDNWIGALKKPKEEMELGEVSETIEKEQWYTPSCTARGYSPSNPWNAPGMSVRGFI